MSISGLDAKLQAFETDELISFKFLDFVVIGAYYISPYMLYSFMNESIINVTDEIGFSWHLKHVSYSVVVHFLIGPTSVTQQPPGGHHWKQLLYLEGLSKV